MVRSTLERFRSSQAPMPHPPMHVSFLDPEFQANPFAAYRWLRQHAPVYWDAEAPAWSDEKGVWGVTSYDHIRTVSLDQLTYTSTQGSRIDAPPVPSMINRDEPEHQLRRGIIRKRFTPQSVRALEPFIREAARTLISSAGAEFDFVEAIAKPFPMMVIGQLLGVPEADYGKLLDWSDLIATGMSNRTASFEIEVREAVDQFDDYISEWYRRRLAEPGNDLLSALVVARQSGLLMEHKDFLHEALLLLVGGDETTRHVASGGLDALLTNPDSMLRLRRDLGLLDSTIEEMLRWVCPVKNIKRTATRDVTLGDCVVRTGDKLLLLYESGNRDESVFVNPDLFDIERSPNHHLSFGGFGRHYCLGANLARLELSLLFEELLKATTVIDRGSELPRTRWGTFVLGLESLPIRVTS